MIMQAKRQPPKKWLQHVSLANMLTTLPPIRVPRSPVAATRLWIQDAVIQLKLCPWAAMTLINESSSFSLREVSPATAKTEALVEAAALAKSVPRCATSTPLALRTSIIVLPFGYGDLFKYLDLVEEIEEEMEKLGLNDDVQIATFHPSFQFSDNEEGDAANWTNRSPYPLLHLLRECDVSVVMERQVATLATLEDAETKVIEGRPCTGEDAHVEGEDARADRLADLASSTIWRRNQQTCRKLGVPHMEELLSRCLWRGTTDAGVDEREH